MTVSRIYNLIINIMIQLGLGQIYVFREREYINNFFCRRLISSEIDYTVICLKWKDTAGKRKPSAPMLVTPRPPPPPPQPALVHNISFNDLRKSLKYASQHPRCCLLSGRKAPSGSDLPPGILFKKIISSHRAVSPTLRVVPFFSPHYLVAEIVHANWMIFTTFPSRQLHKHQDQDLVHCSLPCFF